MVSQSNQVAILQTFLYYRYFPFWKTFFEHLNFNVISSPFSNIEILNLGLQYAHSDLCLPIKLAFGHVDYVIKNYNFNYIFLPRYFRLENKGYVCPKLIGFTDMVKTLILNDKLKNSNFNLIDNVFDVHEKSNEKTYIEIGLKLTSNYLKTKKAYYESVKYYNFITNKWLKIFKNDILKRYKLKIGLLGHPYNIHDNYINMQIQNELNKRDAIGISFDDININDYNFDFSNFPSNLFWTFGREIYKTAIYFLQNKEIKINGLIYIAPFSCGLDSVLVLLIQEEAKKYNMPFLCLTIDEHTAKAGIITRIEAFLDML